MLLSSLLHHWSQAFPAGNNVPATWGCQGGIDSQLYELAVPVKMIPVRWGVVTGTRAPCTSDDPKQDSAHFCSPIGKFGASRRLPFVLGAPNSHVTAGELHLNASVAFSAAVCWSQLRAAIIQSLTAPTVDNHKCNMDAAQRKSRKAVQDYSYCCTVVCR